jgi:multidrug efflux pump subunit AcrA (membrane-fusion protein)
MSARCTIVTARRKAVLRVPEACVPPTGEVVNVTVLTEKKGGTPGYAEETRRVTVGLRGNSQVEILSGLEEGERLKPLPFSGPERKGIDIGGDD